MDINIDDQYWVPALEEGISIISVPDPDSIMRASDCVATKDNISDIQNQINILREQLAEAIEQIEKMKKPLRCKSLL